MLNGRGISAGNLSDIGNMALLLALIKKGTSIILPHKETLDTGTFSDENPRKTFAKALLVGV